jgi:hypothetical protein
LGELAESNGRPQGRVFVGRSVGKSSRLRCGGGWNVDTAHRRNARNGQTLSEAVAQGRRGTSNRWGRSRGSSGFGGRRRRRPERLGRVAGVYELLGRQYCGWRRRGRGAVRQLVKNPAREHISRGLLALCRCASSGLSRCCRRLLLLLLLQRHLGFVLRRRRSSRLLLRVQQGARDRHVCERLPQPLDLNLQARDDTLLRLQGKRRSSKLSQSTAIRCNPEPATSHRNALSSHLRLPPCVLLRSGSRLRGGRSDCCLLPQ